MENSTQRFFKLLYIFALVVIGLFLPIYFFVTVDFDQVFTTSYKAKCISNNKYVVLEGNKLNSPYIFTESDMNLSKLNIKEDLNFYCKYYDQIQPHVLAYIKAKTPAEQITVNKNFFRFKDSVISEIYSYPAYYVLELSSKETDMYLAYYGLLGCFLYGSLAFVLLQFLRMCYLYIFFGEIVWHPFRQRKS